MTGIGDFPVTTATAGVLGLLCVILAGLVSAARARAGQSLGDGGGSVRSGQEGGASPLLVASRSFANFAEYAPLALILLGLAEHDLGASRFVQGLAALLVAARVIHPIGMRMKAPNPLRAGGALLTWVMIAAASVHALVRVFG